LHNDFWNGIDRLCLEVQELTAVTMVKAMETTMRPKSHVRLTENWKSRRLRSVEVTMSRAMAKMESLLP
jgi:hypothetical protein